MIRWGIVGAGNIAHRFAKSLKYEEDSILYAISGRSIEKLEAFQTEFPCEKLYVGHENILNDPNVDAVYIALPHNMHKEWAVKAMHAGKAVLCEKPAVMNEAEMQEIAEVSRNENKLFMEAMKTRFQPAYLRIKELIEADAIGELISIKTETGGKLPQEIFGKTYHTTLGVGGAVLDMGCYCVNWFNDFLIGDPIVEKTYGNVWKGLDLYINTKLKFNNASVQCITAFDRNISPTVILTGTKGSIECGRLHSPESFTLRLNDKEEIIEFPFVNDDFYAQIHHFCGLINVGKTESDVMSLNDSIRNARILDTISSSFTDYTKNDLLVLEKQEDALRYESFNNEDALKLGNKIIELQKEYDCGIALRIVREEDSLNLFQYVMQDKGARNFDYAEKKHKAILSYGHSSAWAYVAAHLDDKIVGYVKDADVLPSGGAFPIYTKEGKLVASVLVSGLHEGKDHELILRALSEILNIEYPEFSKVIC